MPEYYIVETWDKQVRGREEITPACSTVATLQRQPAPPRNSWLTLIRPKSLHGYIKALPRTREAHSNTISNNVRIAVRLRNSAARVEMLVEENNPTFRNGCRHKGGFHHLQRSRADKQMPRIQNKKTGLLCVAFDWINGLTSYLPR